MLDADQLHMAAKSTEISTYVAGIGTATGGVMGWLNEYGIAIGALCALITCIANIYFKYQERQDRVKGRRR
jgi:uncharacterized membrane protein